MKVSSARRAVSPVTGTVTSSSSRPAAKVSVPRRRGVVGRRGRRAVRGRVVDRDRLAARRVRLTVKVAFAVPALPSVSVTSLIDERRAAGRRR